MVLDLALLALAFFYVQEGLAHQRRNVSFFVEFPDWLLLPSLGALVLLVPTITINLFVLLRGLRPRRWPWVATVLVVGLLGIVLGTVGLDGTWTIIDPQHR